MRRAGGPETGGSNPLLPTKRKGESIGLSFSFACDGWENQVRPHSAEVLLESGVSERSERHPLLPTKENEMAE
jgi:hypothetical protein